MLFDIEELIDILCHINFESIDIKIFSEEINKKTRNKSTNIEDYFYSATKYDFLLQYKDNNLYQISPLIKDKICSIYSIYGFNNEVKKIIYLHLYSKEKLFQKLLDEIKIPKLRKDIKFINRVSLKILIKWGKDLDIIAENQEHYLFLLSYINTEDININYFWDRFNESYKLLTKQDSYKVKDVFVKIPLLRSLTQSLVGYKDPFDFDKLLLKCLNEEKYRLNIEFSGAPIIFLKNELKKKNTNLPFKRNSNIYYFIALKS